MQLNKPQLIDVVRKSCFSRPFGEMAVEAATGLEVAEVSVSEKWNRISFTVSELGNILRTLHRVWVKRESFFVKMKMSCSHCNSYLWEVYSNVQHWIAKGLRNWFDLRAKMLFYLDFQGYILHGLFHPHSTESASVSHYPTQGDEVGSEKRGENGTQYHFIMVQAWNIEPLCFKIYSLCIEWYKRNNTFF